MQDQFIYENLDFLTGNRTLLYEDLSTTEDICPEEHTTATFSVEFGNRIKPSDLKMYGKAYWTFYEREVELEHENNLEFDWAAETSIGLKQAFGTNPPAWASPVLLVRTPGQRHVFTNLPLNHWHEISRIGN